MKTILLIFLMYPSLSFSQNPEPKFSNDTLYTSSGYKIFVGQTLKFAKGTVRGGGFRYIAVKNGLLSRSLTDATLIVKEIKKYAITVMGNGYIDLTGNLTLKGRPNEFVVLHIAFDWAIENSPALLSELEVPDEFRNTRPRNIKKELIAAKNLYEDNVITKAEYHEMKNKLENYK